MSGECDEENEKKSSKHSRLASEAFSRLMGRFGFVTAVKRRT